MDVAIQSHYFKIPCNNDITRGGKNRIETYLIANPHAISSKTLHKDENLVLCDCFYIIHFHFNFIWKKGKARDKEIFSMYYSLPNVPHSATSPIHSKDPGTQTGLLSCIGECIVHRGPGYLKTISTFKGIYDEHP